MARVAASGRVASTRTPGILYNGGFEIAPAFTAGTNTATRWIDGTAAGSTGKLGYGWAIPNGAITSTVESYFDTSRKRSGTYSLKLSNLTTGSSISVANFRNTPAASTLYELLRLQPNTSYTLTGYISTNNVAASGAYIDFRQYNAAGTALATTSTTKLSGTDATFREVTVTVTTNASAVFGGLLLRLNVTGNISDAWFDDITLTPATNGRVAASGRIAP